MVGPKLKSEFPEAEHPAHPLSDAGARFLLSELDDEASVVEVTSRARR